MVGGSGHRQGLTAVAPLRNPPLSAGRAAAQPVVDLVAPRPRPRRYPRERRRRFGGHCRKLNGLHRRSQIVRALAGAPHEQANGRRRGALKVSQKGSAPGMQPPWNTVAKPPDLFNLGPLSVVNLHCIPTRLLCRDAAKTNQQHPVVKLGAM